MTKLAFGSVTLDDLERLVSVATSGMTTSPWNEATEPLDEAALVFVRYLAARSGDAPPFALNEATLFARAIYPLLGLAEIGNVRAWAGIPLAAKDPYSDTELAGIVDGVLAPQHGIRPGTPGQPFLLVMETKRSVEATDPWAQLLAAMLAALWAQLGRAGSHGDGPADVFGCITVGDEWTFVHAEATVRPAGVEPRLAVTFSWSRAYAEPTEAEAILRILRWITKRHAG